MRPGENGDTFPAVTMAVQYRDYYEILGVSKDASREDIKRAFKKLARANHPDVAKDQAGAEERFKEINEAYEVLGDPEKRKKYDLLGENWDRAGGFPGGAAGEGFSGFPGAGGAGGFPGGGQRYEYHFGGSTGFSDFFESFFGGGGGDPFAGFAGGSGSRGGFPGGAAAGTAPVPGADIEADLLVTIEEVMRGATRQLRLSRPDPGGGPGVKESTVRVKIPVGVENGQLIRCAGLGHPGRNGGKHGDLFLRVRLERHPLYRVRGSALVSELVLAPWEIALGAKIPVPTPHGNVTLTVRPGTQPGTEMRLRGKGLPKDGGQDHGDLYLTVSVAFPEDTSSEEEELWRKLQETSDFVAR